MAKPKSNKPDQHKKRRMVGIRAQFLAPIDEALKVLGCNATAEFVNLAVREKLQAMGLWPYKPKQQ